MRSVAPILFAVFLPATACAHSRDHHRCEERTEKPKPSEGAARPLTEPAASPLLAKFDPALRWAIADKSAADITALAELSAPLAAETRSALEAAGLTILSLDDKRMHVRGDAQALLLLARRNEVIRLRSSQPLRPSGEKP